MSDYYNNNPKLFFEATKSVDMWSLYAEFLPYLPINAKVVDAGCGSGRDTQYFASQWFTVTAFDKSSELVELAKSLTKIPVECSSFLAISP